jgi:hypothetical protein
VTWSESPKVGLGCCLGGRPRRRVAGGGTGGCAASSSPSSSSICAVMCSESPNLSRRSLFGFRPRLDFLEACFGGLPIGLGSRARRSARCECPLLLHASHILDDALRTSSWELTKTQPVLQSRHLTCVPCSSSMIPLRCC